MSWRIFESLWSNSPSLLLLRWKEKEKKTSRTNLDMIISILRLRVRDKRHASKRMEEEDEDYERVGWWSCFWYNRLSFIQNSLHFDASFKLTPSIITFFSLSFHCYPNGLTTDRLINTSNFLIYLLNWRRKLCKEVRWWWSTDDSREIKHIPFVKIFSSTERRVKEINNWWQANPMPDKTIDSCLNHNHYNALRFFPVSLRSYQFLMPTKLTQEKWW